MAPAASAPACRTPVGCGRRRPRRPTLIAPTPGERAAARRTPCRGAWTATPVSTRDWSSDCPFGCSNSSALITSGDSNGDGQADVLFAHRSDGPSGGLTWWSALDADPTPSAPTAGHVLSADVNAD